MHSLMGCNLTTSNYLIPLETSKIPKWTSDLATVTLSVYILKKYKQFPFFRDI